MARSPTGMSGLGPTAVFAALAGALSLVDPWFASATAVLAAIALALWLAARPVVLPRMRIPWPLLPKRWGIGLAVTASGWFVFLALSTVSLGPRAALLGAGTLVLWWLDPAGNDAAGGPDW